MDALELLRQYRQVEPADDRVIHLASEAVSVAERASQLPSPTRRRRPGHPRWSVPLVTAAAAAAVAVFVAVPFGGSGRSRQTPGTTGSGVELLEFTGSGVCNVSSLEGAHKPGVAVTVRPVNAHGARLVLRSSGQAGEIVTAKVVGLGDRVACQMPYQQFGSAWTLIPSAVSPADAWDKPVADGTGRTLPHVLSVPTVVYVRIPNVTPGTYNVDFRVLVGAEKSDGNRLSLVTLHARFAVGT